MIRLDRLAGSPVSFVNFNGDQNSTGPWTINFADISLVSADGSVITIYNGESYGQNAGQNLGPNGLTSTLTGDSGDTITVNMVSTTPVAGTPGSVHYYVGDQLGTVQMELTAGGGTIGGWPVWQGQFAPFGQELDSGLTSMRFKFTGKERDTESGLDYFGARYYGSSMGRFTSPDDGSDQNYSDPQSLNLYPYARNNPITNTDPTGNDCVTQTRTSDTTESVSVNSGNCSGNVGDGQTQTYVNGTVTGISVNGGNSLDIGYNSYDGQSSGVTNAASAPTPDRPGLAYGYGNNAQGYQMLGAASRAVNTGTAIYAGIFAAGACAVYCPAAAATAAFNAKNLYYAATGLLPVALPQSKSWPT